MLEDTNSLDGAQIIYEVQDLLIRIAWNQLETHGRNFTYAK